MKTNRLITLLASLMLAALISSGCTRTDNANTSASNTSLAVNGNANLPPPAPLTTATANSSPTANRSTTNNAPPTRVNKDPEPQIGTGGNDFYLFTQARAALSADSELKNSNIVIVIKDGNATLTGNIPNAEQKARAEQLLRAINGIKDVKNQLNVSAGNAKK